LLTLFINYINVIDYNYFLLPVNAGLRLAKCLEFIAEELDALFLEVVDNHNVVFWKNRVFTKAVVFADNGIYKRGFTRTRISNKKNIQVVDIIECLEYIAMWFIEIEITDKIGFVFIDESCGH
jgi:hypothetical protein